MCARLRVRVGRLGVVCLVAVGVLTLPAVGQTSEKPVIAYGAIKGNNVYVRSGPSANHYPVCKLGAGERVTVVGETGDWYEVVPPEAVFSYISGDYVDTTDHRMGLVNGENVRVRAGSTLSDFADLKYVVQTQLSKGAEVTILGRDADGFLRIKPPRGATVWISREFVEFVPTTPGSGDSPIGRGAVPAGGTTGGDDAVSAQVGSGADATAVVGAGDASGSLPSEGGETPLQGRLAALDAAAREMLAKPVNERDYKPLIERYGAVAQQADNEFVRRYAEERVDQLKRMAAVVDATQRLRALGDETGAKRREFLEERARIRETLPPIPSGVDVQGELRLSALYPPGRVPVRYRLVDPTEMPGRTIGYVEIPADTGIKVDDFVGRYVGVVASATRLHTGGVDPVPVYIARNLILLQPTTSPPVASPSPD